MEPTLKPRRRRTLEEIRKKYKIPASGIATRTRRKSLHKQQDEEDQPNLHLQQQKNSKGQRVSNGKKTRSRKQEKSKKRRKIKDETIKQSRKRKSARSAIDTTTITSLVVAEPSTSKYSGVTRRREKRLQPHTSTNIENTSSLHSSGFSINKSRLQVWSEWSESQRKTFMSTYLAEGKNFRIISERTSKSINQVVEYYYYFKHNPDFQRARKISVESDQYQNKLNMLTDDIKKIEKSAEVVGNIGSNNASGANKRRKGRPRRH
ncbi:9621_t:CDS:2 [Entrophospora sp. SA101]|nr:9621_t:CDS:2 [Entrophospora sp. SA101]